MNQLPREALIERRILPLISSLFAGAVLFGTAYGIWENVPTNLHILALAGSLSCYVFGFAIIITGLGRSRHAAILAVAGYVYAFVVYACTFLIFKIPYYTSDAMLFNGYSAQLLMHGIDPYTQSMATGYRLFGVPEGEITPTVTGGAIYALSYPALSFLVYLPFLFVGITNLLWVSVLAHAAILILLVALAPSRLRSLAPLPLFLDPSYFDYTLGGITDILWLGPAMLVAWYWERNPIATAAWLGVACSVKQTPWVILPFALVHWIALERRRGTPWKAAVPVSVVAGIFALINAPFALWHPHAWLAGILTPLTGHLIVFGSGIAQLSTAGMIPIDPKAFSLMTALAFVGVFGLYLAFPRRFSFLPFLAPAFVFFFAGRSLQNYFMYWPIVLIVQLFAQERGEFEPANIDRPAGAAAAGVVITLGLALAIVFAPRPNTAVTVGIDGERRDSRTGRVAEMRLTVRNASAYRALLRFDVAQQGRGVDVQAWNPHKPFVLAAGERREITIAAPSPEFEIEPDGLSTVQVVAVAPSGREYVSRPRVFDAAPKVQNPDLAYWSFGAHPFPVAWTFDIGAWTRGDVARVEVAGHRAVLLRADAAGTAWRVASVQQVIDARPAVLAFALFPLKDCGGGAAPDRLFGATVVDVVGNRFFFCVDSRLHEPVQYRTPWGLVSAVPGRANAWNVVRVDLRALHEREGLILSSKATIGIGVVSASRDGGRASGYFGGVEAVAGASGLSFRELLRR